MKKIKRNIILLACCITLFSSFVVSATSASNSITDGRVCMIIVRKKINAS